MKRTLLFALVLILPLLMTGCADQTAPLPTASPTTQAAATTAPAQNTPMAAPSQQPEQEQDTEELKDGEYMAQTSEEYAASAGYGWQEYLKVTISGGEVSDAEYNARKDDQLKSETTPEEYAMSPHPSQWIPQLTENVKGARKPEDIDMVTGATGSSETVRKLFAAIVKAARTGDTATVTVSE